MKKILAILLIIMITCMTVNAIKIDLKTIFDKLETLYEALKNEGAIDELKKILDQGKKAVVKLCCSYVSKEICKKYCDQIYGMI